jgi:hypothetical protein
MGREWGEEKTVNEKGFQRYAENPLFMVPGTGIEPVQIRNPRDFKFCIGRFSALCHVLPYFATLQIY